MRVLFDAEDFKSEPRGIVKVTLALYQACCNLSNEISFTGILRKPLSFDMPNYIKTNRIRPNAPRDIWRYLVYNSLSLNNELFHFPANGMIPCLIKKCKIMTTIHDVIQITMPDYYASEEDILKFKIRKQRDIFRSDIIFTDSEYSKNEIMSNFTTNSEPIVIYNAPILNSTGAEPIFDINNVADYFICVGAYDRRKNAHKLIRSFIDIHQNNKIKSKLYLTGGKSYYSQEFKEDIDCANNLGIIKELGYVTDEELVALIRNSKGLIYLSKYEGFGMPPVEAMNIGAPVITTPFTSISEVCGSSVIYVDPDNARDINDAVIRVSTDNMLRRKLITEGRKHVAKYSWERSAEIFLKNATKLANLVSV